METLQSVLLVVGLPHSQVDESKGKVGFGLWSGDWINSDTNWKVTDPNERPEDNKLFIETGGASFGRSVLFEFLRQNAEARCVTEGTDTNPVHAT